MKTYKLRILFIAICTSLLFVQCGNDDDVAPILPTCTDGVMNGDETGIDCGGSVCDACATCNDGVLNGQETGIDCGGPECPVCPTCNDGIQNGDETGIDCGGTLCDPCPTCDDGIQNGDETGVDCGGAMCAACPPDFSGTFRQEDSMGRPGVNTVFSGSDSVKNDYNSRIPTDRASFQPVFQATLELYHDVYATSLGIDPADLDYETNILGLDAPTFTTVLAQFDALQVAPDAPTTYFDGTNALTGRALNDDVIDVSLTLMFGGMTGTRFDGNNGTPQLTSDGVDLGDRTFGSFPYLNTPN